MMSTVTATETTREPTHPRLLEKNANTPLHRRAEGRWLCAPMDPAPALPVPGRTKFETEMQVRPDDIDMNQHVHNTRYFDYVLAARYDQMARCYQMPMEEFITHGFGWVVRTAHVQYKRPLGLGDWMIVRTWIESVVKDGVTVNFQILRRTNGKLCADGYFDYTMVNLATGRSETIPDWIRAKYTI